MKLIRVLDELGINRAYVEFTFFGNPSSIVITQFKGKRIEIYPTYEPGGRYKGPPLYYILARTRFDYPNFGSVGKKWVDFKIPLTDEERTIIFGKTKQIDRLKSTLKFLIESLPPEEWNGGEITVEDTDFSKFPESFQINKTSSLIKREFPLSAYEKADIYESIVEHVEYMKRMGLNNWEVRRNIEKEFSNIDVKYFYDVRRSRNVLRSVLLIIGFVIALVFMYFILPLD